MRYYYKKPNIVTPMYGTVYACAHTLFNSCTLYLHGTRGIAVIQQRFDPVLKRFWWGPVDQWIANDIYLSPSFQEFFDSHAEPVDTHGLYPTFKIRSLMWKLRMKPLQKEPWEVELERL